MIRVNFHRAIVHGMDIIVQRIHAYNDPNYYSSATVYNIETNVYSLKDNKLLWTGITTAPNLSDKKAMMDRVIAMIKQKMKSQGVLK
jgi:hypothetical protein